jgi:hypothetical protein
MERPRDKGPISAATFEASVIAGGWRWVAALHKGELSAEQTQIGRDYVTSVIVKKHSDPVTLGELVRLASCFAEVTNSLPIVVRDRSGLIAGHGYDDLEFERQHLLEAGTPEAIALAQSIAKSTRPQAVGHD